MAGGDAPAGQILRCAQDDKTFGMTRPSARQAFGITRPSACQGARHAPRCHPEGGARRILRAMRRGCRAMAGRRASFCMAGPGDPMIGRVVRQTRCFAAQILRCAQDDKTFGMPRHSTSPGFRDPRPSTFPVLRHPRALDIPGHSICPGLRHPKALDIPRLSTSPVLRHDGIPSGVLLRPQAEGSFRRCGADASRRGCYATLGMASAFTLVVILSNAKDPATRQLSSARAGSGMDDGSAAAGPSAPALSACALRRRRSAHRRPRSDRSRSVPESSCRWWSAA